MKKILVAMLSALFLISACGSSSDGFVKESVDYDIKDLEKHESDIYVFHASTQLMDAGGNVFSTPDMTVTVAYTKFSELQSDIGDGTEIVDLDSYYEVYELETANMQENQSSLGVDPTSPILEFENSKSDIETRGVDGILIESTITITNYDDLTDELKQILIAQGVEGNEIKQYQYVYEDEDGFILIYNSGEGNEELIKEIQETIYIKPSTDK